jgi:hypothetical protein
MRLHLQREFPGMNVSAVVFFDDDYLGLVGH